MTDLSSVLAKATGPRPEPGKKAKPARSTAKVDSKKKPKTDSKTEKKPTKSRASEPRIKRGRGGHLTATNPWTERITLDVTPEQDMLLARFALDNKTKKSRILRQLIAQFETDPNLQQAILDNLEEEAQ